MLERMRHLLERWHEEDEISRMDEHAIADLGMDRAQVLAFARLPRDVPDRMARMAAVHGVPEGRLRRDRGEYLEMVEACGRCGARRICAEVLDTGMAEPGDCGFCPNAETYRRMARDTAH